ncbi:two-component sensor histidine kinase, partial [Burkholderia multivorans]
GQARLLGIRLIFSNAPAGGARTEVIFPDEEAQDIALRQQLGVE